MYEVVLIVDNVERLLAGHRHFGAVAALARTHAKDHDHCVVVRRRKPPKPEEKD